MDKSTIKKLSELSRIELNSEEESLFGSQLEDILKYFELLKEVDTDNIDLEKIDQNNRVETREDDPKSLDRDSSRDLLISNIPKREGEFVKVKKILNT